MLEILGWIVIVWLLGSTIYSTQFHLRNYIRSKDSDIVIAKKMDGPNHIEPMSKKEFLKKVFGLQLYKIVLILLILNYII